MIKLATKKQKDYIRKLTSRPIVIDSLTTLTRTEASSLIGNLKMHKALEPRLFLHRLPASY